MKEFQIYPAIKSFIFKDNQVLVLYKQDSKGEKVLDLPGGKLKYGETPLQGLLRELKEEVSASVKVLRITDSWWLENKEEEKAFVGVNFLCEWQDGTVKLSAEHIGYQWYTEDKVKELPEFDNFVWQGLRVSSDDCEIITWKELILNNFKALRDYKHSRSVECLYDSKGEQKQNTKENLKRKALASLSDLNF